MRPSLIPARNTASHSSPFAACSDASVTPSSVGACWADARSSSSATRSARLARPPVASAAAARSSASATSACIDSHRSRAAPRAAGGSWDQPAEIRTSRTTSGIGVRGSTARPAPLSSMSASRTSRRAKNRSPPRTRYPTPADARACSNASDCAFVRYSTAISLGRVPAVTSWPTRAAIPAASDSSSSYAAKPTGGPVGRCAISSSGALAPVRRVPLSRASRSAPASRLLARLTTCGVER